MADKILSPERIAYKKAVAEQDWDTASDLVLAHPETFGTPPEGVIPEISALASDPTCATYMIVEWRMVPNKCDGRPGCKPFTLRAKQFDHLEGEKTKAEVQAWFDGYVQTRRDHHVDGKFMGKTLFLLKVEQIVPLTDFDGGVI